MWDVLKEYPAARVRLEAIAVKRLEKYKKTPLEKGMFHLIYSPFFFSFSYFEFSFSRFFFFLYRCSTFILPIFDFVVVSAPSSSATFDR